jgi:hypothetical protein
MNRPIGSISGSSFGLDDYHQVVHGRHPAALSLDQGVAAVTGRPHRAAQLGPADLASETILVLRSGKKKYALLRFR